MGLDWKRFELVVLGRYVEAYLRTAFGHEAEVLLVDHQRAAHGHGVGVVVGGGIDEIGFRRLDGVG
jgi:hypothetical protein